MRRIAFALIALTILGALAVPAVAQDDEVRLDLDFKAESLNQVLQMFRRGYGLEYTLGEGVDPDMQITMHLRGVTLEQALQSITQATGLLAIEQNGRYVLKERPEPQERQEQTRAVSPAFAGESRTPPAPSRALRDYEPRRGAAEEGDDEEERDEVMDIIYPVHLGADMAASIWGGNFIEAGGYFGGGGGYGGGSSYGGRGGSSYGGSSGFGSNRGGSNFGSNRGGSSFGSNRGSSNFGSNRGSSFGGSNNRNW